MFCECDGYKIRNKSAAKIGNGILKDLKLVTKSKTKLLLCLGKVRRERTKWGELHEKYHRTQKLPGGIYCDGKKCPTLTRVTNSVPVQVRGARGRGSSRVVEMTSKQKLNLNTLPVLASLGENIWTI